MAKAFWPGFQWRILAHKRNGISKDSVHTGESLDMDSGYERQSDGYPGIRTRLSGDWEFDELVIDHWFHLEQMSDRNWWIGLGDQDPGSDYFNIYVRVDGKRRVTVYMEQDNWAVPVEEKQG